MKRSVLAALLTMVTFGSMVQAQETKPAPKKPAKSPYVVAGTVQGELTMLDTARRTFKFRVTTIKKELNQGAYRSLLQAQQNLKRAQLRRDVNGIRSAQRSIAQNQLNLYTVKKETKEYTIQPIDEFEVRRTEPKDKVDEMGNFVKLTKQEIAKLRGKDKFFDAKWEDLEQGQPVMVQVVRPRKPEKGVAPMPGVVKANKVVIIIPPK